MPVARLLQSAVTTRTISLPYEYLVDTHKLTLGVNCSLVPRPCARSSLAVRNSCRGPGLVHHVMCAAAVILRHTRYGHAVLQHWLLEEPETGHARTIDYNSKLKLKKTRSRNPGST